MLKYSILSDFGGQIVLILSLLKYQSLGLFGSLEKRGWFYVSLGLDPPRGFGGIGLFGQIVLSQH